MERLENLTHNPSSLQPQDANKTALPIENEIVYMRHEYGVDNYLVKSLNPSKEQIESSINIFLLGQSGSGKTTLINAAVNHLLGVDFESSTRYLLEPSDKPTKSIRKYYVQSPAYKDAIFCLIDTPGLAESEEQDDSITTIIETMPYINAILLTSPKSSLRMTDERKRALDFISQTFGQETSKNLFITITHGVFENTKEEKQLAAQFKEQELSYEGILSFNNVDLLSKSQPEGMSEKKFNTLRELEQLQFEDTMNSHADLWKSVTEAPVCHLEQTKQGLQTMRNQRNLTNDIIKKTKS